MESQSSLRRVTRSYNVSSTGRAPISISKSEYDSDQETELLSSSYSEDVFTNSRVTTTSPIKQRNSNIFRHNTSDYSSEENEESSFDKRHSMSRNGNVQSGDISDHKPYQLYKEAGEYWNKYPKTDYTYSRYSPHRRELEPGVIVMPNMSRRSIHSEERNLPDSNKSNYVFEKTSRSYYSSDRVKRRLEEFLSKDEVDYYKMEETLIQKILRITRITLIYTIITNYFHSFTTNRSYKSPNKRYSTSYNKDQKWYQKIWVVISSSFAKIASAYYTLLGSILLFDSWLLRRNNHITLSEEELSQNTANQLSEDRRNILRSLGYAFLILALLLLGVNYGTNIDLNEYIPEIPELPELPEFPSSIPSISVPKPISEYVQSSQDAFMETFEYTKLATNEYYNELYKFFLSEYLSLNKNEPQAEQPDKQIITESDIVQPQEDEVFDAHNSFNENYDPFNDENVEL